MNKYNVVVFALMGASLLACAAPPSKIKPVYSVGAVCTLADRERLDDLWAEQKRTASQDAWGVFWLGIPTGKGQDHAPEIARLKGRCNVK